MTIKSTTEIEMSASLLSLLGIVELSDNLVGCGFNHNVLFNFIRQHVT